MGWEERRLRIGLAVAAAQQDLDATYARQGRQEWAASRRAEGWSAGLVETATSAGALASVREAIAEPPTGPPRLLRAAVALAAIETGLHVETRYPRIGKDRTGVR